MKKRLLVPFTHGVDMYALEYAVQFAKNFDAELVAASVLPRCDGRKSIRLEHIQQSKDFHEAIANKARRYDVPVHVLEMPATNNIQQTLRLAQEQGCDGIMLFVREGQGVLMQTHEIKHIMVEAACKLYILRLPSHEGISAFQDMMRDVLRRLGKDCAPQSGAPPLSIHEIVQEPV